MEHLKEREKEMVEITQFFSHPHLLNLSCSNKTPTPCTGCSLQPSPWRSINTLFNHTLHMPCTRLPQLITSPAHPAHRLALRPKPAYSASRFICNSCRLPGDGFCYHCSICNIHLHVLCASLPPLIKSNHFHPTHNLSLLQTPAISKKFICDCCGLLGSGSCYRCNRCNFDLHVTCASLPSKIKHPSHPNHPLFLHQTPVYPRGKFCCNGCYNLGYGLNYHCNLCRFDLHVVCSSLPLCLTQQSHPHTLELVFGTPYKNKRVSCDICNKTMGSNHWAYHCAMCNFDTHLDCATSSLNSEEFSGSSSSHDDDDSEDDDDDDDGPQLIWITSQLKRI